MAYNPNGNSYRTARAGYAAAGSSAVLDQGLLRVWFSPGWWRSRFRTRRL
jgi:hypothetical protein